MSCVARRKLNFQQLENQLGTSLPRGQRQDDRYDRRAVRPGENSKGFITVAKPTERRLFLSRRFLDIRLSRPWRSLVGILVPKRDSSGNSNLTNGVN